VRASDLMQQGAVSSCPAAMCSMGGLRAGDSKWLITAGADSSVRLWDVEKGTELCKWDTHQPARSCAFAQTDQRLAAYTTSAFATVLPSIRFIRIADVPADSDKNPILQIDVERTQAYVHQ
jgi:WD40 repeat protein